MVTVFGDVTGRQRFPLLVKSFRNTATCQKLAGRVPSPPPPLHPLKHGGGVALSECYVLEHVVNVSIG